MNGLSESSTPIFEWSMQCTNEFSSEGHSSGREVCIVECMQDRKMEVKLNQPFGGALSAPIAWSSFEGSFVD